MKYRATIAAWSVLTDMQFAFVAGVYCMWLVWCGVTDWRAWSEQRKLARVSEQAHPCSVKIEPDYHPADRATHCVGYHCLMPRKRERKQSIELRASSSGSPERPIHPNIHESLVQAIKNTNFVTLVMRDHSEESGEPQVYGQRGGHPMVLLYNGETDPTWQLIEVRDVAQVKIWLDEHFSKRELPPEFDPDRGTH